MSVYRQRGATMTLWQQRNGIKRDRQQHSLQSDPEFWKERSRVTTAAIVTRRENPRRHRLSLISPKGRSKWFYVRRAVRWAEKWRLSLIISVFCSVLIFFCQLLSLQQLRSGSFISNGFVEESTRSKHTIYMQYARIKIAEPFRPSYHSRDAPTSGINYHIFCNYAALCHAEWLSIPWHF